MKKTLHTINGKFSGVFYELDDGRKLYLAHRTPSQVLKSKMAWVISESVLRQCEQKGITAVGFVMRQSGKAMYWLTHIDDFHNEEKSFRHFDGMPQRGLPMKWFRVHPGNDARTLDKITTILK